MSGLIIHRLVQSIGILMLTSVLVFFGVFAIGDPVQMLVSADASPAEMAQAVHSLGLDQPMWTQYALFVQHALHGDLGRSFVCNRPAIQLILERLPATLELALVALALGLLIGLPLGLLAGLKANSPIDRVIMGGDHAHRCFHRIERVAS